MGSSEGPEDKSVPAAPECITRVGGHKHHLFTIIKAGDKSLGQM